MDFSSKSIEARCSLGGVYTTMLEQVCVFVEDLLHMLDWLFSKILPPGQSSVEGKELEELVTRDMQAIACLAPEHKNISVSVQTRLLLIMTIC